MIHRTLLVGASVALLPLSHLHAQDGVTKDRVLLGQSCALKGPAKALGRGMRAGLQVYFDRVNGGGGIKGRRIELVTINDGYEPARCRRTTAKLLEKDKVFALIGQVGTPTSLVAVPLAERAKVPFVAPFTGAEFLRDHSRLQGVVNLRASYYQEMEALAAHLVGKLGLRRIACFYQDDGYGRAGLAGIERALKRRGLKLCSRGTYKRNTVAVLPGLQRIRPGRPEAVVMVGAYRPCAEFIRQAKASKDLSGATFCNISFVGTKALARELRGEDSNCIVSQVVPHPWKSRLSVVREYTAAMIAAGREREIGFISLEGYLAGKLFCTVLERIEGRPTRARFLAALQSLGAHDLGGLRLAYGPDDNQGLDQVFLTRLDKGQILELVPGADAAARPGK